ncbi:MAG: lysophospholipid acyltransferase family protein [Alcanivoracaceae bacterium]|nr:lysophospholipid acyltransferase family protein [Alcanivoracaceae bacterium]
MLLETVFFGVLCLLLAPFISARRVGFSTAIPWAKLGLMFSWVTVKVHGHEHIDPKQSYIVVANHLSLFDIWVLYGWLNMDLRWVAKKEVRYIPIIGICCVALGHIFVDRRDNNKARASLDKARHRIVRGTSILFFPEGTRSRSGALQPFKKGAFHMAKQLSLPILPVSIVGTREILPSDTSRFTPGRTVTLVIHPPISQAERDVDSVIKLSHDAIAAGITTGVASAPAAS